MRVLLRGAVDENVSLLSEEEGSCGRVAARFSYCISGERTCVAEELSLDKTIPQVAQLFISS